MRKSKIFSACVSCILSLLILSAYGADSAFASWKNYSFVNYTGRTIRNLYITATGYNKWGSDLLGNSVLGNGDSVSLRYNNDYRYYDIKVIFSGGDEIVFEKCDYKAVWRMTIFHRYGSTYTVRRN